MKSSSSVGANYRAAQRAKSTADFINKLKIVEEEADESMYFLELFIEILGQDIQEVKVLHSEANEIISIVVASINTAKKKSKGEIKFKNLSSKIKLLKSDF
ncbi:four helix bundle protein [Salinimicrobium sp. CAU 1759]